MSAPRRMGALAAGVVQAVLGLVLLVASVESLGLVTGEEFTVNVALAVPALLLLGTVGLTVAWVAGRSGWRRIGVVSAAVGAVLGVVVAVVVGSALAGGLLFVFAQLVPALVPAPAASQGSGGTAV